MSNLTAARLALFGAPVRAPRAAKPYDHMSKAEMWKRIEKLERRLALARTMSADLARDAHNHGRIADRDRHHSVGAVCDLSVDIEGKE